MTSRRVAIAVLIACAAGLFAYSGARALALSFTHDEANTYDLLQGNLYWKSVANHHPLNTLLMSGMERWLGPSEWALRFPNVVAHALYLATGLLLLSRARHPAAMAMGFAFCNLNPFLLDFFSLARGYGLALGLSMAALWLLCLAFESPGLLRRTLCLFAGLACASLADLANYTWLNLHLPLLAVSLLVLLVDGERFAWRIDRGSLAAALALVIANGAFIRNLAVRILALQKAGQLYARGEIGFLADTVGSSLDCYFYELSYPEGLRQLSLGLVVVGFSAIILNEARLVLRNRRLTFASILALATALAVATPIAEHVLLKAPYPNERIALYYFPLAGTLLLAALDRAREGAGRRTGLVLSTGAMTLAALMTIHFARTANGTHTLTWHYDAHTRDAMRVVERHFEGRTGAGQIRIGNSWLFEPAMNYYRNTLHFAWLAPIRRDDPVRPVYDVLYFQRQDIPPSLEGYRVLQDYPDTGSVILVRDPEAKGLPGDI